MGVIINLKEIFAADGQEIFTDKINFNFNKFLELGIGEPGVQGIQGPVGALGPPGIQGEDGQRGNRWFIGTGDPNTLVFTDLIIGDFYLEATDSSIWQYQGSPVSWVQITDLSQVITNILTAEGQPFVRGFGEGSPLDDRFITFAFRGNNPTDIALDVDLGNPANNDTLLLTNWNERETDISNFPTYTDTEYNSIQTISVDHTVNNLGRYHLEFSSLYESPTSPGVIVLSSLDHNLKIRYLKNMDGSMIYPSSSEFINKARFSLNAEVVADISQQGIFEFITPKFNDDLSPTQGDMVVTIGTTEALAETSFMDIAVDGLDISSYARGVNIGLVRELETFTDVVTLTTDLEGDWGMLNISANLEGLMIRGKTYHSDPVVVINTSGEFNRETIGGLIPGSSSAGGYQSVFSDGQYLFAVSPLSDTQELTTDVGYFKLWDISDPDNPNQLFELQEASQSAIVPLLNFTSYDIHGNTVVTDSGGTEVGNTSIVPLTGVRDVSFAGKYGVLVRRKPSPPGFYTLNQFRDSFLVFELDSNIPNDPSGLKIVSYLGTSPTFSSLMIGSTFSGLSISQLDGARRVKISGNWAYVITDSEDITLASDSHTIAINITNPARPYIDGTYINTKGNSRHIDFDIHGETAYILSQLGGSPNSLSVTKLNLFNSVDLANTIEVDTQIHSFGGMTPSTAIGSIKVVGQRVYIISKIPDILFVYEDNGDPNAQLVSIGSVTLPTNHSGYDLEVSGRYVYVYALNSITDVSTILTYDISAGTNPVLIDGYADFTGSFRGTPSKMTMVGDKIFTISAPSTVISRGGVSVVDTNGINSPSAKIGNLHSKDIKVANDLAVSQNLQVGRSAAIGSGGLWVDKGAGINTDSGINVNISNNIIEDPIGINLTSNGVDFGSDEFQGMKIDIRENTAFTTTGSGITIKDTTGTFVFGNVVFADNNDSTTIFGNYHLIQSNNTSGGIVNNWNVINNNTVGSDLKGIVLEFSGNNVSGETYGLDISGPVDRNYIAGTFDTPDVQTDLASPQQITSTPDEDTISSGYYEMDPAGTDFNDGGLNWIRIGNIVHAKGWIKQTSVSTTPTGNLPHDNCKATIIDGLGTKYLGTTTTFQGSGSTSLPDLGVYLPTGITNQFRFNDTHGTLNYYVDITYEVI